MNAVKVKTDGMVEAVDVELNELASLQEAVDGYIETIPLKGAGTKDLMIVNEEAKLRELESNWLATTLVRDVLRPDDWIAGDVLLCGGPDRDGDLTPLSREALSWLTDRLGLMIE